MMSSSSGSKISSILSSNTSQFLHIIDIEYSSAIGHNIGTRNLKLWRLLFAAQYGRHLGHKTAALFVYYDAIWFLKRAFSKPLPNMLTLSSTLGRKSIGASLWNIWAGKAAGLWGRNLKACHVFDKAGILDALLYNGAALKFRWLSSQHRWNGVWLSMNKRGHVGEEQFFPLHKLYLLYYSDVSNGWESGKTSSFSPCIVESLIRTTHLTAKTSSLRRLRLKQQPECLLLCILQRGYETTTTTKRNSQKWQKRAVLSKQQSNLWRHFLFFHIKLWLGKKANHFISLISGQ